MRKTIDQETAEEIEEILKEKYEKDEKQISIFYGKKYPKWLPDFVMLFQCVNVTLSKELYPSSCKILLYFLGKMVYGNFVSMMQDEIADELEMSRTTVWRSLKQLKEYNIVLSSKHQSFDSRSNEYYLNPYTAWRGTFKRRSAVLKEIDKMQLELPLNFAKIERKNISEKENGNTPHKNNNKEFKK